MPDFSLKIENSKILRAIVESLAGIIDETQFQVSKKGLVIRAMDPSRICLLQLVMKSTDFDEFTCTKPSKIGINLEDLDKVMKRSSTSDSIIFSYDSKKRRFTLKMKRKGDSRIRTFSLGDIELEIEEIPMEKLLQIEYESEWSMDTAFVIEAIKDAEIYSEILTIVADESKGLSFSSIGQIGEMEYELENEELSDSKIKGINKGSYSLQFLKSILKIENVVEKLTIFLKDDHPIRLLIDIIGGGTIDYFLAPRVEELEDLNENGDIDEF